MRVLSVLETESPWDTYYLLQYSSPLSQERLFPVGMPRGEHPPRAFHLRAAQGWKLLILLNQQQRQNYTQKQNYTKARTTAIARDKTTSPTPSRHGLGTQLACPHTLTRQGPSQTRPDRRAAWFIHPTQMRPDQVFYAIIRSWYVMYD